jgi:hypothetical protein
MDFGSRAVSFAPAPRPTSISRFHAVKLGVNYKFGFPGLVNARY